jgi:hypothetical protein
MGERISRTDLLASPEHEDLLHRALLARNHLVNCPAAAAAAAARSAATLNSLCSLFID